VGCVTVQLLRLTSCNPVTPPPPKSDLHETPSSCSLPKGLRGGMTQTRGASGGGGRMLYLCVEPFDSMHPDERRYACQRVYDLYSKFYKERNCIQAILINKTRFKYIVR